MAFRVDGTEQFGSLIAYRLHNDETGDTVLSWDPAEVAMATGAPAPAPGSPIPAPPVPTPGQPPARLPPGGPSPAPAPGSAPMPGAPPPMASFLGDPGRFGLAGGTRDRRTAMATGPAAGDVDTGTTSETRATERADVSAPTPGAEDDDGLVDMSGEAEQAGGGAPTAPQSRRPEYVSETPFDIGLPMPTMPRGSPRVAAGFRPTTKKQKGDPETVGELRDEYSALLQYQQETAIREAELKEYEGHRALQQGELYRARNEEEQRKEKAKLAQLQDWQTKRLAELDSDSKALAEKQVDENRWYKSAGAGGVFLAALFQGMGSAGASLTGGPNYAMEIFDNFIKADIANQKEEWRSASDKLTVKQNAYARELQNGMSPQLAEKKIELLQNQFAERQLKDEDVARGLRAIGVDTDKALQMQLEKNLQLRTEFESILGQELEQKYREASGGGGPSLAQQIQFYNAMEARAKAGRASGEAAGIFPSEAIQLEREKQGQAGAVGSKDFQTKLESFGTNMTRGEGVTVADLWVQKSQTEDEIRALAQDSEGNLPGRGLVEDYLPDVLVGPNGRSARRALGRSAEFMLRKLTGAAATDPETVRQLQQVAAVYEDNGASDEEVQRAWRSHSRLVENMVAVRGAAYGKDVVDAWKDNYRQLHTARGGDLVDTNSGFEPVE